MIKECDYLNNQKSIEVKKSNKEKLMGFFATLLLLVVSSYALLGCSNIHLDNQDASRSDTTEPLVLTMFSEDINASYNNFTSPVAKEITKRTGVILDIEYTVGNVDEKIDIMKASGDYPDLVMIKDTHKFVEADAYIDLAPLIKEHGPNLITLYGNYMNRLKYSNENPAIYVLPSAGVDPVRWEPKVGFELQHAVVKELGYPSIKTVYDYEEAIKEYIKRYPEIDGMPTIGITLLVDDWRWLVTLGNPAGFATGVPDDGQWLIDPETYEATYRFLRDEEKEYFRWLNHMYDIGLIDPDSFVQKYEAYEAKIASGRVLGIIDAKWQYREAEKALKAAGKFERTYGMYPVQMDDTTLAADFRDTGYQGGYGIGISKNCKDPVKAIRFLDFLASDEGQVLRNWGIEGVHYKMDENGMRYIPEEELQLRMNSRYYSKENGVGTYIYPFPTWGVGVLDDTGNPYLIDDFSIIPNSYSDIEKEVLENYKIETWSDLYPSEEEVAKSDWGVGWSIPIPEKTGISETLTECDAITKKALIEMIVSDPDQFDTLWNQLQEDLVQSGAIEMNEAFTKLVKQRVKLWKSE